MAGKSRRKMLALLCFPKRFMSGENQLQEPIRKSSDSKNRKLFSDVRTEVKEKYEFEE